MNLTKLDKAFSEWIRRKDADDDGFVTCCTCPTRRHWKQMDAGHYMSRKHLMTRWYELNVHPQCPECNREKVGNPMEYERFISDNYGATTVGDLRMLSRSEAHFTQAEIDELTEYYKAKIREL